MALQYLDALKALADGDSTKWIVPMELSELTRPITGAMHQARGLGDRGGDAPSSSSSSSSSSPPPPTRNRPEDRPAG